MQAPFSLIGKIIILAQVAEKKGNQYRDRQEICVLSRVVFAKYIVYPSFFYVHWQKQFNSNLNIQPWPKPMYKPFILYLAIVCFVEQQPYGVCSNCNTFYNYLSKPLFNVCLKAPQIKNQQQQHKKNPSWIVMTKAAISSSNYHKYE